MMVSLAFAPSVDAWGWSTHSDIVDAVYNALPADVQQKLDLATMRDASNDPDEKFKDTTYHSYPKSFGKAQSWLDQGKAAYNRGDYKNASYCYGVASHYISDTFSAPHCASGEESADHSKYEDQAKKLKPTATYQSGQDLKTMMENGYNQGKSRWTEWLQTKDSSITQKNLNMGASATLTAIKDSIGATSSPQTTSTQNIPNSTTNNTTAPATNSSAPISPWVVMGGVALVFFGVVGYVLLK